MGSEKCILKWAHVIFALLATPWMSMATPDWAMDITPARRACSTLLKIGPENRVYSEYMSSQLDQITNYYRSNVQADERFLVALWQARHNWGGYALEDIVDMASIYEHPNANQILKVEKILSQFETKLRSELKAESFPINDIPTVGFPAFKLWVQNRHQ